MFFFNRIIKLLLIFIPISIMACMLIGMIGESTAVDTVSGNFENSISMIEPSDNFSPEDNNMNGQTNFWNSLSNVNNATEYSIIKEADTNEVIGQAYAEYLESVSCDIRNDCNANDDITLKQAVPVMAAGGAVVLILFVLLFIVSAFTLFIRGLRHA